MPAPGGELLKPCDDRRVVDASERWRAPACGASAIRQHWRPIVISCRLTRAAVDALVLQLCAAIPGNRALVDEAVGLPATRASKALLTSSKAKIGRYVAPGPDDDFQLEAALDQIEHYLAQTGDHAGEAELLVHFLTSGVSASHAYGDLFDDFYGGMAEAAARCADLLDSDEELAHRFLPSVSALLADADRRLSEESFDELVGRLADLVDDDG